MFTRIRGKEVEETDSIILILDIDERGGRHRLPRQIPIEGDRRRPVGAPVFLLMMKNLIEQLVGGATALSVW
ncbi:Uncharacterised protein [Actinomyces viscosus]|uniref:Uncharacterized protein n=1 Tax=Actinomyces viscosus TaxID=1656 RepID=A0A3S4VCX9_ACTVI|nr:Uncharacterised protein [Actinomyces viscosus]